MVAGHEATLRNEKFYAELLVKIFQPVASKNILFNEEVLKYLHSLYQKVPQIKPYKISEVTEMLQKTC